MFNMFFIDLLFSGYFFSTPTMKESVNILSNSSEKYKSIRKSYFYDQMTLLE